MGVMNTSEESAASIPPEGMRIGDIRWTAWILIGLCLACLGLLYAYTFTYWYRIWMMKESYYSHGILVPFISAFLVYLKRKRLAAARIEPSALGYLILIPALAATVLAIVSGTGSAPGLTFPVVLAAVSMILMGRVMTRELALPIGYLYFMCVLPGFILVQASFRIQMLSTMLGTAILNVLGLHAERLGAMITLPNIEVMVGAPCSGFRLLISLFAFSVLFAYVKEGPWWGKAVLIGLTLPLSVLLNGIRVTMIAIVGEYMGSEAMHSFHDYSGYLMLVLAFVLLSLLARFVKCRNFSSML